MSDAPMTQPIIQAAALHQVLLQPDHNVLVCDCRSDLVDQDAGLRTYLQGHIPGAIHVHLDRDLSAPKTGSNGRHPLPDPDVFVTRLAAWGVNADTQIVRRETLVDVSLGGAWQGHFARWRPGGLDTGWIWP